MAEQAEEVVNEEGSQPQVDSTTTETEQDPIASEGVNTQEPDGKDYKTLYTNARKALQEKNRKIQELKQDVEPAQTYSEPEPTDDEGVQRFLRTEADAFIARKAMTDPGFRDLLPEIEKKVAQGIDIRTAEMQVKAEMFDGISSQIQHEQAPSAPNFIKPSATPEPKLENVTIENIASGKVKSSLEEQMLAESIRQTGGY